MYILTVTGQMRRITVAPKFIEKELHVKNVWTMCRHPNADPLALRALSGIKNDGSRNPNNV